MSKFGIINVKGRVPFFFLSKQEKGKLYMAVSLFQERDESGKKE
jgi:hypothetical protein